MTDKEIVIKAIEKIENKLVLNKFMSVDTFRAYIIFSITFSKAFWGEGVRCLKCGDSTSYYNSKENNICIVCNEPNRFYRVWEYHLQQMVILDEEARINYLERYL